MISEEEKWTVATNMYEYGGSFVKALSEAIHRADRTNLHKIKATWPEYWDTYLKWGKK